MTPRRIRRPDPARRARRTPARPGGPTARTPSGGPSGSPSGRVGAPLRAAVSRAHPVRGKPGAPRTPVPRAALRTDVPARRAHARRLP